MKKKILPVILVIGLLALTALMASCFGTKEQYTVTFNSGGGSGVSSETVDAGGSVSKPADPTKDDYIFDGWYDNASFTGEKVTFPYTPTSNVTMYAKWTAVEKYTVTFNSNGGGDVGGVKAVKGYGVQLPTKPAKADYVFAGWYAHSSLTGGVVVFPYFPTGDITLYARWVDASLLADFSYNDLNYPTGRGGLTIMKYTGTDVDVVIPDGVTNIASYAFADCSSLTSVAIPDSVTGIIDSFAFYNCSSLASITIPDGVTIVGEYAFAGTAYYKDASNWDNNVLYIGNHLIKANTSISGSYTVKESTKIVAGEAFANCSNLTSVIIGDSVTSIGARAFYYCSILTSITIPDSVISIGDNAFYNCRYVTSITIGSNVTSIGISAFSGCSSLTSITIPDSVTSIGHSAFYDTAYYKNISNWNNNVLYIGNHLIEADANISGSYVIKAGTKTIASDAFENCSSLTSVTIGSDVTSIGNSAFDGCSSLTSIAIGSSVTSIGEYAFHNCRSLTSVIIGSSVTSIGNNAFGGCDSLTNVTFDNTVGWHVYTSPDATSGTGVTVTDAAANATYLKSTYRTYYWYCT